MEFSQDFWKIKFENWIVSFFNQTFVYHDVVRFLSCFRLCNPMDCGTPGCRHFAVSQSLLKLMFVEMITPSTHLILCLSLPFLPSIFPGIRVFSNESVLCIRWPKYWSFGFSVSPSNEYSGLISFRIDWFDLFDVQGTLKSLPQSKSSIHSGSAFFMVQPSHLYMMTGKTLALTYMDLCQQSGVSAFYCLGLSRVGHCLYRKCQSQWYLVGIQNFRWSSDIVWMAQ